MGLKHNKNMQMKDKKQIEFHSLLFQLGEILKEPPTVIDCYDWLDTIDALMRQIRAISKEAHDKLDDLICEVQRRGQEHVRDIDANESPSQVARSADLYFEQVSYTNSEINDLKEF